MLAAAAVLLDSVDSAEAVVLPEVPPLVPVLVAREPQLPAPLLLLPLLLLQLPRDLLLRLLFSPLPRAVVASEVRAHLRARRWFSAATARSSPPTGKPTYERGPSTR